MMHMHFCHLFYYTLISTHLCSTMDPSSTDKASGGTLFPFGGGARGIGVIDSGRITSPAGKEAFVFPHSVSGGISPSSSYFNNNVEGRRPDKDEVWCCWCLYFCCYVVYHS